MFAAGEICCVRRYALAASATFSMPLTSLASDPQIFTLYFVSSKHVVWLNSEGKKRKSTTNSRRLCWITFDHPEKICETRRQAVSKEIF